MVATLQFHADGYLAGTRQRPHRHEELHLSLVLSGRVTETVGHVTVSAGALSVVAKDAGVVHANDFGPNAACMVRLTLQAGTIAGLIDDPARASSWRWTHSSAAGPYLRLVRRATGARSSFPADDPDLLDLLAAVSARPAAPPRGCPPRWLVETMEDLRGGVRPGGSVAAVARRVGVHPVYLARCVRRWYGTSVGDELRRLRLQAAASVIAEPRGTLSQVAHEGGFSDEPHLCRDFRRVAGMTPGRFRRLVRNLDYTWRGGR